MAEPAEDKEDFAEASSVAPRNRDPPALMSQTAPEKKRNAFAELMSPKPKAAKSDASDTKPHRSLKSLSPWKGALLDYIKHPEQFPDQVLRVTPNTVLIKDSFPKATVHLLLLPRSPEHYGLHPHDAFKDLEFLAMMKEEAASAARIAAAELGRQLSPFSATSKARNEAMDAGVPFDDLPPGRDYLPDIRIGIHAHPSMAHLHVHIISRDMHSDRLKHRKHYNSFNTSFFIPVADYPLADDDERRRTSFQNANLSRDFVCWRCKKVFGNRFAELKRHLEEEFESWKKE
ncbi:HIT-like domain-containing protein [Cercophora newfieldiana]|uniref:Aprataxin-like protein n=1 Tax=Cercophora newfieldiana TaxID=92897 RepID=A0AA39Y5C7_9PEZI|nr:HIT-like domain-containing protein [Cercophora newfieldiana]